VIRCLLVANRGEIARRVIRACRTAGIETVAVYSDADAAAPHVREADRAVRLPGRSPGETYLRGEDLVAAALAAGADAVHPGYGFLSEQASFARAVTAAGLVWVGPDAAAIAAMGSKTVAKDLVAGAGVPVLEPLDPEKVTEGDLPVLVKAAAGGGGRGMRVVDDLPGLPAAVAEGAAEAARAFGDETVFCEPFLARARHVEVQLLADAHGTVWALGERDCSVQRRHQKVIEESPAPGLDAGLRERLCAAAVAAARTVGYLGAGTAEFLLDADGRFYFLEMNTRLQVEHPVTECVTGTDLVRWQLRIAEGAALPPTPPSPSPSGHAIEARLYAEDPADAWRPHSGVLHHFSIPGADVEFAVPPGRAEHGLRVDSGVVDGSEVGVYYDPMLAKVIAWAPTRAEAARRLAAALAGARIHGLRTNRDLLVRVLRHPRFLAGQAHTGFLQTPGGVRDELVAPLTGAHAAALSALAAALADAAANRGRSGPLAALRPGWRNLGAEPQRKRYTSAAGTHEVAYRIDRDGGLDTDHEGVRLLGMAQDRVDLEIDGVAHRFLVARYGDTVCVDSPLGPVELRAGRRFADPQAAVPEGSLLAPMPAAVTAVEVARGARVATGQVLLVLEAMKMRHPVRAPRPGVVRELRVGVGAQVSAGDVLAILAEAEGPDGPHRHHESRGPVDPSGPAVPAEGEL
jgi:propionyl-CoA carboxylase alpha chain